MAKNKKDESKPEKKAEPKAEKKSEKKSEKKPNVFARAGKAIATFFREIVSENKKIVWPTPKATFRNMGIVLVIMLIAGLVIFGVDSGLHALFGLVMEVAGG